MEIFRFLKYQKMINRLDFTRIILYKKDKEQKVNNFLIFKSNLIKPKLKNKEYCKYKNNYENSKNKN